MGAQSRKTIRSSRAIPSSFSSATTSLSRRRFRLQVTPSATGTSAELITYDVCTVNPQVAALVQASGAQPGHPTTADIITSAQSWNTIFPNIPNTNLCDWIADDVGAAAGAAMPEPNQLYDPSLNVSGGFWRIVYTGSSLQNWSPLVQPGDVVRMQWFKQSSPLDISGHTTTVLGIGGPGGSITVYDNVNFVNGKETIGIHSATYWTATNPESITIYRLDPNQQYLIQGTSLGEVIHGSVYNNLIQPGGGADIITAGPGSNEIQDTIAHLNGIAVTDFHFGDEFDFTDLNPAQVTATYTGTWLLVFNNNVQVATILLPGLPSNDSFVVTPDGNGGSLIAINSPGAVAVTAAGDFTSNGHPDFVWRNSNAVMSMWGYDPQAQTVSTISLGTVPFSWSILGSAHFSNASTSQMLTDYVPNGTMTLWWVSSGKLTGIDLGQNWPNIGFLTNGQFTNNGGANISDFLVTNLGDHHLYDWWIGADNALHGIDLGLYWTNVALVAPGQFTANGGTNLLVNNTADNHLYDWWIGANGALQGIDLGPYWSNVAFVATGDFTASGNTNLLVNNTLDNHLYDWWIGNDNALHGVDLGAYWSNVQLVAAGRFDDNTANGEILVQNTVDHHLYEWWISAQGQLTGIDLGPYWANVQLIGHAHYNENSTQEQLLVRNTSDGHFYQWWIANNQLTGVNLDLVAGSSAGSMAAASPAPANGSASTLAGASMMSPGIVPSLPPTSTASTSLLVQAMASFGSTEAVDNSPGALVGAAPSQLAEITAPVDQHPAHR
jgi:hypothetical protein